MNLHVVSIEYSLAKPDPSLGDEPMCKFFHRVSSRCPLLHLFGYIFRDREDAPQDIKCNSNGSGGVLTMGEADDRFQQRSVCVHVHGVYPYFLVAQCDERVSAVQFGAQLEAAAIAAFRLHTSMSSGPPQLLHRVEVVWLLPFYGYHASRQPFFKVYVIDPDKLRQLVHLLCSTTQVGGLRWQVYEGHSPFHFQFMVDYGVKGMTPFCIPSFTARAPLPDDLQTAQVHADLRVDAVLPKGEPPRITCAELEVDVMAHVLRLRDCPMEPGENLYSVRRSVQKYFLDHGVDDLIRLGASSDVSVRCYGLADLQRSDPAVAMMRHRALAYMRARASNGLAVAHSSSNVAPLPCDKGGSSTSLTLQLMEDMQDHCMAVTPLLFSSSSSSLLLSAEGERITVDSDAVQDLQPLSFAHQPGNSQQEEHHTVDSGAAGTTNEDNENHGPHTTSSGLKPVVGDSVRFFALQEGSDAPPKPLFAKITGMDASNVRLRWYLTLRETHLAGCQEELEKCGRWLCGTYGEKDRDGNALLLDSEAWTGELLLGDVEDENLIEVLVRCSRVEVYHSYPSLLRCTNSRSGVDTLLCRYNYHISERRLSAMGPYVDYEMVVFPALLRSRDSASVATASASNNNNNNNDYDAVMAGVADEGEELLSGSASSLSCSFSSSFTSFFSSSSSSSSIITDTRGGRVAAVRISKEVVMPSVNNSPTVLRCSVSAALQQAAQSQISLLFTCTGVSSLPSPQALQPPSLPDVVEGRDDVRPPRSPSHSSSVECIDLSCAPSPLDCKPSTPSLQACCIVDDVPRNFKLKYDESRNRVMVSGATWPFATPVAVPTAASGQTRTTAAAGGTWSAAPMFPHIAPSQDTSPPMVRGGKSDTKTMSYTHSKWRTSGSSGVCDQVTCSLRVMYVEVLICRRHGVQDVSRSELHAVALGRASTTSEKVGVRIFAVSCDVTASIRQQHLSGPVDVVYLPSEAHLLRHVLCELRAYDPDLLVSWESDRYGIGILALRYHIILQRSLARDLSRLTASWRTEKHQNYDTNCHASEMEVLSTPPSLQTTLSSSSSVSAYGESNFGGRGVNSHAAANASKGDMVGHLSRRFRGSFRVAGRIVIDLSKQLRKELRLPSHTLQMVHQKLFHTTLPLFTDTALTEMYFSHDVAMRRVALSVLLSRTVTPHRIAQHLNFYIRTAEFSRMYGILFYEVLTRGSQYRVEATLHRMAKPLSYALLSPSHEDVRRQPRLQSMPLIMQPCRGFYKNDPVVVLDFRSLYPSIIIAYNICYSSCLGVVGKSHRGRFGVMSSYTQVDSLLLPLLTADEGNSTSHRVTFAPNGSMFLTQEIREGVLPQMLRTMLATRFEIQAALKHVAKPHEDIYMQQVLHEQQMSIKMLANTTYGYTAASFTGRMPCVDVADAIVMLGRQTLERAMQLIRGHPVWNAEVVYGDTDSLFVRLPGRTKEEAFSLGEQMAREVTASNPSPIQLQLEKVLLPCLLLAKKRYVGYAYVSPEQRRPHFLAKGIETLRRDQCSVTSRLAERMIRALFSGASVDALRDCFNEQVGRLQRGECNPAECIFRKAVRLGRYRHVTRLPPSAFLALRLMEKDIMRTPYWGERIPYVVIESTDSTRLRDQVVEPQRLLSVDENLRIDSEYYIKRHIIPTLDRMFSLVGVNCANWYASMPRRRITYCSFFRWGNGESTWKSGVGEKRGRAQCDPLIVDVDVECHRDARDGEGVPIPLVGAPHCLKGRTLDAYCQKMLCAVCLHGDAITSSPEPPICAECLRNRTVSALCVVERRRSVEQQLQLLEKVCLCCIGSCGEVRWPGLVDGDVKDIEDMHFAIPHQLAFSSAAATYQVHGERRGRDVVEGVACVSIDCHLSFEKKRLFLLYTQLLTLERYVTSL